MVAARSVRLYCYQVGSTPVRNGASLACEKVVRMSIRSTAQPNKSAPSSQLAVRSSPSWACTPSISALVHPCAHLTDGTVHARPRSKVPATGAQPTACPGVLSSLIKLGMSPRSENRRTQMSYVELHSSTRAVRGREWWIEIGWSGPEIGQGGESIEIKYCEISWTGAQGSELVRRDAGITEGHTCVTRKPLDRRLRRL